MYVDRRKYKQIGFQSQKDFTIRILRTERKTVKAQERKKVTQCVIQLAVRNKSVSQNTGINTNIKKSVGLIFNRKKIKLLTDSYKKAL